MIPHPHHSSPPTGEIKCNTTGGPQGHVPCIFPFKFKGKTHNACTVVDAEDNRPWCSTKITSLGYHITGQGNWGVCGELCPIEPTGDKYKICNIIQPT